MAWLSLVPSLALCAAILVIPGLLVTLAVRVRGFDALALSLKDWGRELGFQHPSGQVWINPVNSDNWKFYPGQENHFGANTVDPIWTFDDHHGYYFGTGVGHGPGTCPASVGTHTY